ncbi:uncharacterized protein LOC117314723 [Pecten maximus]|uniref:uncharacterized protein LOC117314723 n=1 Tax=Pecten maximus TaxID=6579 RepID=UPI0014580616|nr:uncharacterized protein LOC117314723 [Pecten maximus]
MVKLPADVTFLSGTLSELFNWLYTVHVLFRLTKKIFGLITKKKESISLIKRQSTVRKNRLCATATDSEIAAIANDWFRFVCDRDGGRKRREEQKRTQQAATATINAMLSDNSEHD